jgi:hypothetical protein
VRTRLLGGVGGVPGNRAPIPIGRFRPRQTAARLVTCSLGRCVFDHKNPGQHKCSWDSHVFALGYFRAAASRLTELASNHNDDTSRCQDGSWANGNLGVITPDATSLVLLYQVAEVIFE